MDTDSDSDYCSSIDRDDDSEIDDALWEEGDFEEEDVVLEEDEDEGYFENLENYRKTFFLQQYWQ